MRLLHGSDLDLLGRQPLDDRRDAQASVAHIYHQPVRRLVR
jgi:hypothetical protein